MTDSLMPHLIQTLSTRAGFDVVNQSVTDNQVRIIHRVAKEGMPNWLVVMQELLQASETAPWSVDLSKQYFLRNGRLIYGWRFILQAPDVLEHLDAVIKAVEKAPRARRIIEEQPLAGASAHRNTLVRGRGAQSTLRSQTGPASWNR